MLGIHTHTCTHTWTYTPSPHFFLALSVVFSQAFRWLLRLVSLPQSRAKYSLFSLFSTPTFTLLALLFLSFFLSFLRLFRYLFKFLTRAPPSGTVCVCVKPCFEGFSELKRYRRGQQGIHSSAANEDSCGHSVKQIGTPICVPAEKTFEQAVQSALFDSWWLHVSSHKPSLFHRQLPRFCSSPSADE